MTNDTVAELIARSNRLGSDPKNTNYAGGNTSAKGSDIDPVTGAPVDLLWVKGSGGDLGTLTENGLAVLRLDRMRALVDVYPGVEREDEMVAAFDYCLHGRGGAAPSIDTAMHGLVDAAHVDHLHPDSGIALATAADGEALTKQIFGDRVVWVPWRRPGIPARARHRRDQAAQPAGDRHHPRRPRHHRVGRHLRRGRGALAGDHRHRAALHRHQRQAATVRSRRWPATARCPTRERRAKAAALAPFIRGLASTDKAAGRALHRRSAVLEFLGASEHPRLAALGTSCPDHFLRTKVKPMVLDLPADASVDECRTPAGRTARGVPRRLPGVLRPPRDRRQPRHPGRRPGDRARSRASECSATARTSRPRGSPVSSTSTPST